MKLRPLPAFDNERWFAVDDIAIQKPVSIDGELGEIHIVSLSDTSATSPTPAWRNSPASSISPVTVLPDSQESNSFHENAAKNDTMLLFSIQSDQDRANSSSATNKTSFPYNLPDEERLSQTASNVTATPSPLQDGACLKSQYPWQPVPESLKLWLVKDSANQVSVVSDYYWNAAQETLYLYSIPHLVDDILKSREESVEEMPDADEVQW